MIVPTWNEEAQLPACLRSVGDSHAGMELIVADGGSTDRTVEIARAAGAKVVISPVRQRAAQLNLAVQEATGEALLFLHADTSLPRSWRAQIARALDRDPRVAGGAFQRRFDHPSLWLRATCALADWRGRAFGLFFGDQAMFVRAAAFWSLGGFRYLSQCEDLDFSLRLARHGRTRLLHPAIVTSGRRFLRRGPVRQTWSDLRTAVRFIAAQSNGGTAVTPEKSL
ncbi:MAG: TIGR04283 family arsenosugar biosynthesis glycosyltransferase [Opitutae bacterium]|nr:TIGR04283 family arsenosugar biosynthesis glycosyltransferase [Opitutae bacterium]